MVRRLSPLDVFHRMTGIFFSRDAGTSTTTTNTSAKGGKTIDFASTAGFAIGDVIRIGREKDPGHAPTRPRSGRGLDQ